MGFVNKGSARMTLLSPNGDVDTYNLKKGDIYFIPKAYPHHIENMGKEELHFLVFFKPMLLPIAGIHRFAAAYLLRFSPRQGNTLGSSYLSYLYYCKTPMTAIGSNIGFNQSTPGDIGFSAGVRTYSNEVLGALLNTDPAIFEKLPDYHEDLLIVSRINPR